MSRGIDYGLGRTNIDHATDIRYGVISPHSLSGDALADIYDHGDNLTYAAAKAETVQRITDALAPVLDDLGVLPHVSKYTPRAEDTKRYHDALTAIAAGVWEDIEQDWNDQYTEDNDAYRYTSDGYVLETSSLGIYVVQSPFYTFAAFCSPCAPGAGDLDAAIGDGAKTYCLAHDWFDDGKAPYPVYRVADHTEVFAEEK